MGAMTAQILIGAASRYDDGINPGYALFLSENSRPAWILNPIETCYYNDKQVIVKRSQVWIPTVNHMLEDGLLMIAVHVLKDPTLLGKIRVFSPALDLDHVSFYDDFSDEQRSELYAICREVDQWPKLAISLFKGAHIAHQVGCLQHYTMQVEVCENTYSRLQCPMTGKIHTNGSLG